jgi:succinate dehydrogenase / fumarate reductase membrane anchor subunit
MKTAQGAHSGTGSWLTQRASAVVMAFILPLFVLRAGCALPLEYAGWRALFEPLWMKMALMFFTAAMALHAWVGMRDIFMDYVHHTLLRLALYLGVILTLAGCVAWMAAVLWGM